MSIKEWNAFPRLSKAPIVMAILETKFVSGKQMTNDQIQSLVKVFKNDFPIHQRVDNLEIEFKPEIEKTPVSVKSASLSGYSFVSEDKRTDFFISVDTFTFKQHGEYDTWKVFKERSLSVFDKCSAFLNLETTQRLSLRYINSIEVSVDLTRESPQEQFFNTVISNNGALNKIPISHYSLRYTHPLNENKIMVNFGQELRQGIIGNFPFIIDIDVLYINSEQFDREAIDKKFDELREIKNQYFFDNLTKSTYDQIK